MHISAKKLTFKGQMAQPDIYELTTLPSVHTSNKQPRPPTEILKNQLVVISFPGVYCGFYICKMNVALLPVLIMLGSRTSETSPPNQKLSEEK